MLLLFLSLQFTLRHSVLMSPRPSAQAEEDGVYRRVFRKAWEGGSFTELPPAPPSARFLWLWLLCGPESTHVPGCLRIGAAGAAEILGWSVQDFLACFEELVSRGMAVADWEHRLVWLPAAIRYNPPANPNTTKAWASWLVRAPKCLLLNEIISSLRNGTPDTDRSGQPWRDLLPRTARLTVPGTVPPTVPGTVPETKCPTVPASSENREQRTENREQRTRRTLAANDHRRSKRGDSGDEDFEHFWKAYPKKTGGKIAALDEWKKLKPDIETCLATIAWQKQSEDWRKEGGKYILQAHRWLKRGCWAAEPPEKLAPVLTGMAKLLSEAEEAVRQERKTTKFDGAIPADYEEAEDPSLIPEGRFPS